MKTSNQIASASFFANAMMQKGHCTYMSYNTYSLEVCIHVYSINEAVQVRKEAKFYTSDAKQSEVERIRNSRAIALTWYF